MRPAFRAAITAGSIVLVAAMSGHRLRIGSPFNDKILDCTMDH